MQKPFIISGNPTFEKERFLNYKSYDYIWKYLEKADSRKLVLAKSVFFDLAKFNPFKVFGIGNIILNIFSDLIKSLRLSGWVLRFVTNLKKKHSGRKLNLTLYFAFYDIAK